MYGVEFILELILLAVFAYETFLAFQPLTLDLQQKQDRLKFVAVPAGSLLLITFIVAAFSDLHALIGIMLLLIVIILSATLVAYGFEKAKANSIALWGRNGVMLLIAVYDLVITPLISR